MAAETHQLAVPEKAGQAKVGEVVSTKMTKTIVVEVTRRVKHPLYKRVITKRRKFYAHDENETARTGDVVRITEHRPLSHLKRWALADIIRKAVIVEDAIVAPIVQPKKKTTAKKPGKS